MTAKRKETRRRKGRALSIWIDPKLKAQLQEIGAKEDRTASAIARRAIEQYLNAAASTPSPAPAGKAA
jgi:predicted transcriptional regulator